MPPFAVFVSVDGNTGNIAFVAYIFQQIAGIINAAKIFPAARRRNWSNVFRISVTLTEDVDLADCTSAQYTQNEDGTLSIAPDCAVELPEPVANDDGTVTYTYTLKDGLKWSDGKDLTAKDFEFAWKRAASVELAADYGYMFEIVKGYPDNLAVEATDDKTLVVTLNNACVPAIAQTIPRSL